MQEAAPEAEAESEAPFELAGAAGAPLEPKAPQPVPVTQPVYTGTPIGDVLARDGWQPVEEQ